MCRSLWLWTVWVPKVVVVIKRCVMTMLAHSRSVQKTGTGSFSPTPQLFVGLWDIRVAFFAEENLHPLIPSAAIVLTTSNLFHTSQQISGDTPWKCIQRRLAGLLNGMTKAKLEYEFTASTNNIGVTVFSLILRRHRSSKSRCSSSNRARDCRDNAGGGPEG